MGVYHASQGSRIIEQLDKVSGVARERPIVIQQHSDYDGKVIYLSHIGGASLVAVDPGSVDLLIEELMRVRDELIAL